MTTLSLTVRVINSSFVFGQLILPYFMFTTGILLGILIILFIFLLSYYQSRILLEVKFYAKKKTQVNTISSIFNILGYSPAVLSIFRCAFLMNSFFVVILLFTIFGKCLAQIIQLFANDSISHKLSFFESQEFFIIIGGVVVIPFILRNKYPAQLVAIARAVGVVGMIIIVIISIQLDPNPIQIAYLTIPDDFSFTAMFASAPSIVLAFAYHQQYFTGYIEEEVKKIQLGSFLGSLMLMIMDIVVACLGQLAFHQQFAFDQNNLIEIISQCSWLPTTLQGFYFGSLAASAIFQILQHIPQSVNQIRNIYAACKEQRKSSPLLGKKKGAMTPSSMALSPSKQGNPRQLDFNILTMRNTESSPRAQSYPLQTLTQQKTSDFKPSPHEHKRSYIIPISAISFLVISILLALLDPPVILPVILMGAITQNSLSIFLPSFLFLKWQDSDSSRFKLFMVFMSLLFSLSFGFVCLLSAILQAEDYYSE